MLKNFYLKVFSHTKVLKILSLGGFCDMMHIIKKKIIMTEELKSRITLACSFNNIEPKIMEGNLRIV